MPELTPRNALKLALDDFAEKEALCREEVQLLYDQIEKLTAQIEVCKERMLAVQVDRQRVLEISNRYTGGSLDTGVTQVRTSTARPVPAREVKPLSSIQKPASLAKPVLAARQVDTNKKPSKSSVEEPQPAARQAYEKPTKPPEPELPSKQKIVGLPPSGKATKPGPAPQNKAKESADKTAADEMANNINEALRGLFR